MKTCITCGIEKDELKFRKSRSACKMCESVAQQKRCEDPVYRGAKNAANRERLKDPGYREAKNAEARERRKDPAYREARNAEARERRRDPEVRAALNESNRERRKDPAYRAAEAEAHRENRKDPTYREARNADARERRRGPEVRAARNEAARKVKCKRRNFLNLLKMERPCYDCGGMFPPEATDWDHLPGKVKSFNLSTCCVHPLEEVTDEINKCQLVCSNCHRIRTSARRQKKDKEI